MKAILFLPDPFALENRPDLDSFFDPSREEHFFVKNPERVQGDKRDAIILTIGYGKDRDGNLPFRFGPLLSAGGERLLNVAVTRARHRKTLASPFSHTDMDLSKVKTGTGVELPRYYLQYAATNGKLFGPGTCRPTTRPSRQWASGAGVASTATFARRG